jgi:eukaryotic-like serine/threonine-protein kinase
MALAAGTKLGPYEILAPIGAGGMGEVYRARDTRLGREVAIKVSAERFSERFEKEAHAIAALNHPNICTLHDVGPNYLVMELVEGEPPKGPMPLEEALRMAKQIAEALEAAHEKGIVHRDLKPANIKIKPDGTVKVLDFGLAKTAEPAGSDSNSENSPTLTLQDATRAGVILGSAGYMSPEQARGKRVDKRADIWAFGVVLHELLTGQRLFQGEDLTETLAAVVKEKPDLSQAPTAVRRLLQSCLEKDPKNRLRDIGDAWRLLEETPAPASVAARPRASAILPWGVAILAAGLAFFAYRFLTQEPPRMVRFSIEPPPNTRFIATPPSISPDGRKIAFGVVSEGKNQIWIRDLDTLLARPLPGTEGQVWPAWSPDSHSLAFMADGKLKRIDIGGGPAVAIADTDVWTGGSWGRNDVIVFGRQNGLYRVAAGGGTAMPVTALERASGEIFHGALAFLPDGRHFLYGAVSLDREKSLVYAGDIDSKEPAKNRRRVPANLGKPVYAGGFLLFTRENTLMAQPFDAKRLETTGDAVPIGEQVADFAGLGQFDASQDVLAYISGPSAAVSQLTWYDRSGKPAGRVSQPGLLEWVSISPDGSTAAFTRNEDVTTRGDIWLHDLARGTDSRFTFGALSGLPVWSPDGQRVAYTSVRAGTANTYVKAIGGAGQEEALDTSTRNKRVEDWSRDGRYILQGYYDDPKTKADLWALPMSGDRKAVPYLNSEFTERFGRFSPDGRWVAYMSDENRRDEIYVQRFPTPGGKVQISTNGGAYPAWSRDGKELFFISPDGKMMGVEVKSSDRFIASTPRPLFDAHLVTFSRTTQFDVSKDGRFLIPSQAEPGATLPMTVVVNWQLGLKK